MPSAFSALQIAGNMAAVQADMHGMRHPGPIQGVEHAQPLSSSPFTQETFSPPAQINLVDEREMVHNHTATEPVLSSAPQPTLYVKRCTQCSWQSIPSTDPLAYAGAVSDYESHKKEVHTDTKDSGDFSSKSKDNEEYKQATKLRTLQACGDDGVLNFSPARFFRAPMSWKNSQLALPLEQTPVCAVGDYEPFGLEVNNRPLIRDIHNLGCKTLKLKLFTDINLKVVPSQQDTLIGLERGTSGRMFTRKEWKDISNAREAIKAASNYSELYRFIHPLYSGPQILFKVILIFGQHAMCVGHPLSIIETCVTDWL